MEKSQTPYIISNKSRKRRTIRILRINRIVSLILAVGIIAAGVIVFFAVRSSNKHKVSSDNFYYLQMGEFTKSSDALNKSLELKDAGASGYIINDGVFRIMAAVYRSKQDAESVKNRLQSEGRECTVYEYVIPAIKLPKFDGNNDDKEIRKLLIYSSEILFTELQKLDIQLDKSEITESAVLVGIGNLKADLKANHEKVLSFLSKYPTINSLHSMDKMYSDLAKSFDNYLPDGELTIDANIKSILCSLAEAYKNCLSGI